MGRLSEKQVTLILGAGMFVLALLLIAATWFYLKDKNSDAREENDTTAKKEKELQGKAAQLRQMKEKLPDLQKQDAELVDVLPTREERRPQVFHEQVYQLARESNTFIRNAEEMRRAGTAPRAPGAAPAIAAAFERVSYRYSVEGEFYNLAAFLSRLEGAKRFTKVVNVKYTPLPKTITLENGKSIQRMYVTLVLDLDFFFLSPG